MKPNVLYVHSHDTGRYIQPYGHAIPTPHMQRLAEQGVLFRQAFCAAPTCSPSRAALLTGQCPHSNGMLGLAHRGFSLNDYGKHIVHTLRTAGYHSVLSGVQHVARDPGVIGYDRILETKDRSPDQAAVEFLRSAPTQPFFLSVGSAHTHRVFPEPGPAEDERYTLPPSPMPDTPSTRRDMASFKASARLLDEAMGQVFGALDAAGLADSTLVICTTDHGIAFPCMKCHLTDHGTGVMLIMRGPGGFEEGNVCDALVSHIDIFPTICELLEVPPPDWLEGHSMMPLLRGKADQINEQVYCEVTYHAAYEPMRAVRTQQWKYIRRFDERTGPVLPNCDDSPSKDVWLERGWRDAAPATEQLYDLVFDPHETNNLAGDPSREDILEDMRGRLLHWMERTNDPLLRGPVPAPAGARVNDPDALSPSDPTRTVP